MSTTRDEPAPWDNSDYDVILRSIDAVEFKADKLFLMRAFQGFQDMFSGDAIGTGEAQDMKDGRPVIPLPETSATVERLLQLIYPIDPSPLLDKSILLELCVALDKYCVRSWPQSVIDDLATLAKGEPELVYIRACRWRLPRVAEAAARSSLRCPKEFRGLPKSEVFTLDTRQYHAFVSYQYDCLQQAVSAVRDLSWTESEHPNPPGCVYGDTSSLSGLPGFCAACSKKSTRVLRSRPTPKPRAATQPQHGAFRHPLPAVPSYFVTSWLDSFLDSVESALIKDTSGSVAADRVQIERVLGLKGDAGVACMTCKNTDNTLAMIAFGERLKEKIESSISTISLSSYSDDD